MDPEAVNELIESARHYEKLQSGLGNEFLADVRDAIERILADPDTGLSAEEEGLRVFFMRRFPFRIVFDVSVTPPFILAVYHHRSNPKRLKTRKRKRRNR
jgi:hypothetical protein